MKIITAAQLSNYNRLKDRSVKLTFHTSEKSSREIMEIDSKLDTFGYLMFKPEEQLTKEEIEQIDNLDTDLFDTPKTQSQRLRNVLYKVWQQNEENDFKEFYKQETEKIIQHYKSKLNG
jgi:hypothetical protein